MFETIKPHGGCLINRIVSGKERDSYLKYSEKLPSVTLNSREISDIEMISTGAFSPLEGFMCRDDYSSVVDNMRLSNGLPWTIPVTLSVTLLEKESFKPGEMISLKDVKGGTLAVMKVDEIYPFDKEKEAVEVYGTTDDAHPGVKNIYDGGGFLIGGDIHLINRPEHVDFKECRFDPMETRRIFKERGWKRVVGFQTRNPIHRAHEYLQKCALEIVDGLLIHPLMGETKKDDIPAEIRMKCYDILMQNYYPGDRAILSVFPAAMRYAGPREAVFHALIRKNYGCTHFIVGRDHAGVGNYYGTFDAHYIFDNFDPEEIGIIPMFFDYAFFCRRCGNMASYKSCPHDSDQHITLSGTKVREMLRQGIMPPPEFSRPEVAKVLMEAMGTSCSDEAG